MFHFTIREWVLLTTVIALSVGWWLERMALIQSCEGWRTKAEELEQATVPYTYRSGSALSGFREYTLRVPIVSEDLQRALTRSEEAEAELRQRRLVEARFRESRQAHATKRSPSATGATE